MALTCSASPEDRERCWSLHPLSRKLDEAEIGESVSHENVRQTLKQ